MLSRAGDSQYQAEAALQNLAVFPWQPGLAELPSCDIVDLTQHAFQSCADRCCLADTQCKILDEATRLFPLSFLFPVLNHEGNDRLFLRAERGRRNTHVNGGACSIGKDDIRTPLLFLRIREHSLEPLLRTVPQELEQRSPDEL